MKNPERLPNIHHFVSEDGANVIAKINSCDLSTDTCGQILVGAILSTNKGRPIRIHIVYPNAVHILTKEDLEKAEEMDQQEFEKFKKSTSLEMAYADYVVLLRRSKYVPKPNTATIMREDPDEASSSISTANPRASKKPNQSVFGKFINTELSSVDTL